MRHDQLIETLVALMGNDPFVAHKLSSLTARRFKADKKALEGREINQDFGESLERKTFPKPSCYYQLKVTLKDTSAPCWRRIIIPDTARLSDLHDEIKYRFDYFGARMAQFYWPKERVYIADTEGDMCEEYKLVPDYKLSDVLSVGMRISYTFDFQYFYEHTILVEKELKSPDEVSKRLAMEKGEDPYELHGDFKDFDDDFDEFDDDLADEDDK